jgi:PPK2 family polyphosphate:nucleotide phosphotransferase
MLAARAVNAIHDIAATFPRDKGKIAAAPRKGQSPLFRPGRQERMVSVLGLLQVPPMNLAKLVKPFRIDKSKSFRLKDISPKDTRGLTIDAKEARAVLKKGVERLSELQEMLYAQDRWAVLVIFQAMDAAGKDSAIKHVMSGVNQQGCDVHSFKAPSAEDLDHDFMWRCLCRLPQRGRIGIFNRSYYEEALVVRVHPELLAKEALPDRLVGKRIWEERFDDINAIERYLTRNGVAICKFFLHLSKAEQKRRFIERLDDPDKNWKFSPGDVLERQRWNEYMRAYEDMIRATSNAESPWHVVPADNKWFTRLAVAAAIVDKLESLGLAYPKGGPDRQKQLKVARQALENE